MMHAAVCTLLSDCGSISASELLCCPLAILGRDAAQNMNKIIALYALVVNAVATHCDGRQVRRAAQNLAAFPGDVGRSLAVHRATLLQGPLEKFGRPGCALGGEYHPGT